MYLLSLIYVLIGVIGHSFAYLRSFLASLGFVPCQSSFFWHS